MSPQAGRTQIGRIQAGRIQAGRIAFLVEGEWWKAYWAPRADTMEGAILLMTIKLGLALTPRVKKAFMDLARSLATSFGEPHTAPEHERSGSA